MAIRLTVYAAERIITGACEKVSPLGPDGKPSFSSHGTNDGHEWEARCGVEVDLDPSLLADSTALHQAVTGYQRSVTKAMREELARMGAPITNGNGHQAPAPPPAPATNSNGNGHPAPQPSPAKWGGPAASPPSPAPAPAQRQAPPRAPEPEDVSQDEAEDDSPPPKTGSQLFGWVNKQPGGGKDFIYGIWRELKYKGKIMDSPPDKILAAYHRARKALREGA